MTSKVGTKVPERSSNQEIIINFDPHRLSAPFFLRCGAVLIDYILVLIVPVAMMLLGRYFGNDGAKLVGGGLNDTGWMLAILVGIGNFVLLPLASGRSIGKIVTGLKIVSIDGRDAKPLKIVLRNLLGYSITLLTLGLGFLLSALNSSGRSLHDYLFGTVVIYADRKYK
jgi:uncharacterized RDD family membrane protein YckC